MRWPQRRCEERAATRMEDCSELLPGERQGTRRKRHRGLRSMVCGRRAFSIDDTFFFRRRAKKKKKSPLFHLSALSLKRAPPCTLSLPPTSSRSLLPSWCLTPRRSAPRSRRSGARAPASRWRAATGAIRKTARRSTSSSSWRRSGPRASTTAATGRSHPF